MQTAIKLAHNLLASLPDMALIVGVMVVCYALMLVGGIMVLVAAFRQSVLWGLACLFVPFASFVFCIMHWQEAKSGFLLSTHVSVIR